MSPVGTQQRFLSDAVSLINGSITDHQSTARQKVMSRVFEALSSAVYEKKNPAKPEATGTSDHRDFPMNEHELESEDRRHFQSKPSWVPALLAAGAVLIMAHRHWADKCR